MKWYVWLGFDAVFWLLLTLLIGPPLVVTSLLVSRLPLPVWGLWGLAPGFVLLFILLFIGMAGLVRLALPALKPGTYPFPGHVQSIAWLLHFAMQRIMNQPLWARLMLSVASLRWCLLRALGARVAFDMQTSNDIILTDPSMITVGAGSMLASGTLLTGHLIENHQLTLAPVTLAPGVQVMGGTTLAPGLKVGENSVIGPGTRIFPHVTLGDDVHVGMGCLLYNEVQIGHNAVLGHEATLESGVIVGEGAVVQAGSRVAKGTVIGAGECYPPRAKRGGV